MKKHNKNCKKSPECYPFELELSLFRLLLRLVFLLLLFFLFFFRIQINRPFGLHLLHKTFQFFVQCFDLKYIFQQINQFPTFPCTSFVVKAGFSFNFLFACCSFLSSSQLVNLFNFFSRASVSFLLKSDFSSSPPILTKTIEELIIDSRFATASGRV